MTQRLKHLPIQILIVSFLVFLDQLTKIISINFSLKENFFGIIASKNYGSAFSMFSSFEYYSYLIAILSLIVLFFLIKYRNHFYESKFSQIAYLLFISGIIGNFIDRVFLGYVRDFIYIKYFSIFNLADIYLTIGVLLLLYSEFVLKNKKN